MVSARVAPLLLVGVVGLTGCSGDDPAAPEAASPAATAAAGDAPTTATLGRVTGDLDRARRGAARDEVAAVVDRWFTAAFLGVDGAPTSAADAFPGFGRGAGAQARADRATTTNLALPASVDDVVGRRGEVVVDLLATGGRAQAATARFTLVMELSGERVERVERVTGRLYLTPDPAPRGPGWQVVGYDVERGRQR